MKAVQTANPSSFESVWAILERVGKSQEKLAESHKEYEQERNNDKAEFNERLGKYVNLFGDFVVVEDDVKEYALNQGLYLIEPAGEDLTITPPNGKPKEW